jgi:hypothetical protein
MDVARSLSIIATKNAAYVHLLFAVAGQLILYSAIGSFMHGGSLPSHMQGLTNLYVCFQNSSIQNLQLVSTSFGMITLLDLLLEGVSHFSSIKRDKGNLGEENSALVTANRDYTKFWITRTTFVAVMTFPSLVFFLMPVSDVKIVVTYALVTIRRFTVVCCSHAVFSDVLSLGSSTGRQCMDFLTSGVFTLASVVYFFASMMEKSQTERALYFTAVVLCILCITIHIIKISGYSVSLYWRYQRDGYQSFRARDYNCLMYLFVLPCSFIAVIVNTAQSGFEYYFISPSGMTAGECINVTFLVICAILPVRIAKSEKRLAQVQTYSYYMCIHSHMHARCTHR